MEPAVGVDCSGCSLGHLVVALHDIITARNELSVNVIGNLLIRLGINDTALHTEDRSAYGIYTLLDRIGGLAHGCSRRSLGLTVCNTNLSHIHLLDDLFHCLDRTRRACHDTCSHVREICLGEVLVTEHSDKHCRYTVERCDLLLIDTRKTLSRRESCDRGHRCSVSYGSGHSENHSEAVEHRNLYHHSVCGRKIHAIADSLTIVYDIVVSEHYAFGEACSTRGILHIADIVDINSLSDLLDFAIGNVLRECNSLLPSVAALVLRVDGDYILEERKLCGFKVTGLACLKLGTKLLDYVNVADVLDAVYHDEGIGIGLSEKILSLVDTVLGIHGNENSSDLCSSPKCDVPLRNIGSPDSNMIALLYAHCEKSACEVVNIVSELGIGSCIIQLGISESVLVRELLTDTVEHIGECIVYDTLLRPRIIAVTSDACLKRMLVLAFVG